VYENSYRPEMEEDMKRMIAVSQNIAPVSGKKGNSIRKISAGFSGRSQKRLLKLIIEPLLTVVRSFFDIRLLSV
jgi:hypothetical protein